MEIKGVVCEGVGEEKVGEREREEGRGEVTQEVYNNQNYGSLVYITLSIYVSKNLVM